MHGFSALLPYTGSFVPVASLPVETVMPEAYQVAQGVQLFNAEKDLAHALELARKEGVALPTAAAVSQGMARIYRLEDRSRR